MIEDTHDDDFAEILDSYVSFCPMADWLTADLVHLATLIDIELQQRADEEVADRV